MLMKRPESPSIKLANLQRKQYPPIKQIEIPVKENVIKQQIISVTYEKDVALKVIKELKEKIANIYQQMSQLSHSSENQMTGLQKQINTVIEQYESSVVQGSMLERNIQQLQVKQQQNMEQQLVDLSYCEQFMISNTSKLGELTVAISKFLKCNNNYQKNDFQTQAAIIPETCEVGMQSPAYQQDAEAQTEQSKTQQCQILDCIKDQLLASVLENSQNLTRKTIRTSQLKQTQTAQTEHCETEKAGSLVPHFTATQTAQFLGLLKSLSRYSINSTVQFSQSLNQSQYNSQNQTELYVSAIQPQRGLQPTAQLVRQNAELISNLNDLRVQFANLKAEALNAEDAIRSLAAKNEALEKQVFVYQQLEQQLMGTAAGYAEIVAVLERDLSRLQTEVSQNTAALQDIKSRNQVLEGQNATLKAQKAELMIFEDAQKMRLTVVGEGKLPKYDDGKLKVEDL